MKKSPETFCELCDLLVVQPYYSSAANALGIDAKTILRWLHASQQNSKDYTFVWGELEAPLHEHVRSAMRMNAHLVESNARRLALDGFDEVVVFQGQVQYQFDETLVGKDLDDVEFLTGFRDYYKRDSNKARIPLTVRRKPSDALILKVLAAAFPAVYGDHSSVDVNHGGVVKLMVSPYARDRRPNKMKTIEHVSAEDRLVAIRERMRIEAEEHLNRPDRVTTPQGHVKIIPAGDTEIHDQGRGPMYSTKPTRPGDGAERVGLGPDPQNPDGRARGFKRA